MTRKSTLARWLRPVALVSLVLAYPLLSNNRAFAQVPQISLPLVPSSVAPGSVPTAGPGLTITANGTGFTSSSVVNWNGSPRQTTFVSSTRLRAVLTAEDTESPGTAWVTVSTPGVPTSNVAYFEVTNPTSSVSFTGTNYTVGSAPPAVMVADFNGDGNLDLAVPNIGDNSVSILLGNGDGTFRAPITFATGTNPLRGVVGDFNGDGKLDIAIPNKFSNNVSVLLGNGDGTFQPAMNFATASGPVVVAAGDFNGDGKLDFVTSNRFAGSVSVLLGNGDGTFQAPMNFPVSANPESVAVGDFNGDGKLDLVVADVLDATINVLLGNGDGTFQGASVIPLPNNSPFYITAADLNGDGRMDLAVTNLNSTTVSVLLGNGDGTFQSAVNYATGTSPGSVIVGDLNGDGKPDLLVANYGGNSVSVLLGNGDGTFQGAANYTVGSSPSFAAFGDFNNDGRMDVAASNQGSNTVSILLQPTPTVTTGGLAQLSGGNSFSGNQAVNGTVTATSFFGNGSGLTNVTASSANNANFAMSAGDAMTLGGIPATGFAPASGSANYVAKSGDTMSGTLNLPLNGLVAGGNQFVLSGGNVGIGTTTPEAVSGYTSLHIDNAGTGFGGAFLELTHSATGAKGRVVMDDHGFLLHALNSEPVKIKSGNFNGGGDPGHIYINTNGNVGIGTGTPAATLEVNGTAKFDSAVTFAPGQTFPGTGAGTISGVSAGTGLSGGGSSGSVTLANTGILSLTAGSGISSSGGQTPTLSLNTSFADGRYAQLGGANTFTANQMVPNLTATGTIASTIGNFLGSNSTQVVLVSQAGSGSALTANGAGSQAVLGTNLAGASTGVYATGGNFGVVGYSFPHLAVPPPPPPAPNTSRWGIYGWSDGTGVFGGSSGGYGVYGGANGGGTGVAGQTAYGIGINGISSSGIAGAFNTTGGGKILSGQSNGTEVFSVASSGAVTIGGGGTPIAEYISSTASLTIPALTPGSCTTFTTAPLTGFTPGSSDTIALGTPSSLVSGLGNGVFLLYQAWETTTTASPTITIQVCNPTGVKYKGGATGTIRVDVFTH